MKAISKFFISLPIGKRSFFPSSGNAVQFIYLTQCSQKNHLCTINLGPIDLIWIQSGKSLSMISQYSEAAKKSMRGQMTKRCTVSHYILLFAIILSLLFKTPPGFGQCTSDDSGIFDFWRIAWLFHYFILIQTTVMVQAVLLEIFKLLKWISTSSSYS